MLNIRKAEMQELDKVREFYYQLIDEMQFSEYKTAWQKGVYPSDDMLISALNGNELFIGTSDDRIICAMIINHKFNDEYNQIKWSLKAEENEVMVIHALGVMPSYSGNGYAKQLVAYALKYAVKMHQKAVRLDVLAGNLPAEKLYTKAGFKFREEIEMYYKDTGWTRFKLFEYVI